MNRTSLVAALGVLLLAIGSAQGQITRLYVRADAPAGGNGWRWGTAYRDLLEARNHAAAVPTVREIWVAAGIYRPGVEAGGNRAVSLYLPPNVTFYGGFTGSGFSSQTIHDRNPGANLTLISGDLNGSGVSDPGDSYRVISALGVTGAALDGFTIIHGHDERPGSAGAGLYVQNASVAVGNCVIRGHRARAGGAVRAINSSLLLYRCALEDNDGLGGTGGGAAAATGGFFSAYECTFVGNDAGPQGSQAGGGALLLDGTVATITRCRFFANTAPYGGGAIYALRTSGAVLGCEFGVNSAPYGGAVHLNGFNTLGFQGSTFIRNYAYLAAGAVHIDHPNLGVDSYARFDSCRFLGNYSAGDGGAIYVYGVRPAVVSSCTFASNHAQGRGGGLYGSPNAPISNTIFWGNTDSLGGNVAQLALTAATPINSCTIQDWSGIYPADRTNGLNPQFRDFDGPDNMAGNGDDDLRLVPGSPCVDSGDSRALLGDWYDLDGDGNTAEPVPHDVLGLPRRVDDPATPDTGVGPGPAMDRGALELYNHEKILVNAARAPGGDGVTWGTAFNSPRRAAFIAAAAPAVREVWVAQGIYRPESEDLEGSLNLPSGVAFYGGFVGTETARDQRDPVANVTVLSGVAASGLFRLYHVVTAIGTGPGTRLDGFNVRDGKDGRAAYPGEDDGRGGGLFTSGANLEVVRCRFTGNFARFGAGAMLVGSDVRFDDCTLDYNTTPPVVTSLGSFGQGITHGGGIATLDSNLRVEGCRFQNNLGGLWGGGICHEGGGLTVIGSIFFDNSVGAGGGGIAAFYGPVDIASCLFVRNIAHRGSGLTVGEGAVLTLTNSVLSGNIAYPRAVPFPGMPFIVYYYSGDNAGIKIETGAFAEIHHCTIASNLVHGYSKYPLFVDDYTAGGIGGNAQTAIRNSVLWHNYYQIDPDIGEADQVVGVPVGAIHHSCVQGWTGALRGQGNHGRPPLFVDLDGPDNIPGTLDDNARLRPGSSCIDAGDAAALPPDRLDLDDDGNVLELLPVDLDGLVRTRDDPGRQNPPGSMSDRPPPDMGAYEFQGMSRAGAGADLDGDGVVTGRDLLTFFEAYAHGDSSADLDGDGVVGALDLRAWLEMAGER